MSWEGIFSAVNAWAMLGWAVLLLAPRKPLAMTAVLYLGVALLCLAYAVMLGLLLTGVIAADGPAGGDFSTVDGVMRLFDSRGGTVIGWTHYLAFDLFAGLWIARDADAKGFGRLVQAPVLLLTLFAGPAGLLLWLAIREKRARRQARGKA